MSHEVFAANQREQQKAETRRRLVEAATEVFLESPPATASLAEIADRGGVRRQTLLYHFGNRGGLMRAVVDHHLATFNAQLRTFGGDLPARLRAYLDAHKDPLVRLVRHLDVVAPDSPDSPLGGLWYSIVANDFEQQLLRAGIGPAEARKRAPVLTLALLHMADRVATDRSTDEEIQEFVTNASDIALA